MGREQPGTGSIATELNVHLRGFFHVENKGSIKPQNAAVFKLDHAEQRVFNRIKRRIPLAKQAATKAKEGLVA